MIPCSPLCTLVTKEKPPFKRTWTATRIPRPPCAVRRGIPTTSGCSPSTARSSSTGSSPASAHARTQGTPSPGRPFWMEGGKGFYTCHPFNVDFVDFYDINHVLFLSIALLKSNSILVPFCASWYSHSFPAELCDPFLIRKNAPSCSFFRSIFLTASSHCSA